MATGFVNLVKAQGESILYVQNNDATPIGIGKAVCFNPYATGTEGVILANANDKNKKDVIGVAIDTIAAGEKGYIVTFGTISNIDTTSFAAGSKLYLGTSAGLITSTLPASPNYKTFIGYCITSSLTGEIFIYPKNVDVSDPTDSIIFNENTGITPVDREMVWDDTFKTLGIRLNSHTTLQMGQEEHIFARNVDSITIPDGAVVAIVGGTGQILEVKLATAAAGQGLLNYPIGLATQPITVNGTGYVTTRGLANNIPIFGAVEGDNVWLSVTPGQFSVTSPAMPNFNTYLGTCVKKTGSTGTIYVTVIHHQDAPEIRIYDSSDKFIATEVNAALIELHDTKVENFGWEDLRFPATSINPVGAAAPATFDPDYAAFAFADNAINSIAVIAQLPHAWKLGTELRPHIHWHPTTTNTGNVLWRMEYKWTNINEVESGSWTTIDYLEAADGVANKYQIASFPIISGTGKTLSSILKIKISRIGNNGTDTFVGNVYLDEFDIHYQEDTLGSSQELVK